MRWIPAAVLCLCAFPALEQLPADAFAAQRALLERGDFAHAEDDLRKALRANPTSPDGHFLLGYLLFREQKATESLAEYTAGAKYRNPAAGDLKTVASDYVLLGDLADAEKWFSEAVKLQPGDADSWYLLGRAQFNVSDFTAAKASFERALQLHPMSVKAEDNLGLCWRELNDPVQAQAAFENAISWQGNTPTDAQPFLNLGSLMADLEKWDKAIVNLELALRISPNNPSTHEQLARVYTGQQNLQKAQSELEQAIVLAPDVSALHYQLGQLFRKMGQKDRAQQEFATCTKLNLSKSSNKTPNPPSMLKVDTP
jgi:Tfp pilus assembly protein PilF